MEIWAAQCNIHVLVKCGISHARTTELIELQFRTVSGVGQRNHVLDGCAH